MCMSYLRRYRDHAVLVVLNMSGNLQKADFDLTAQGFPAAKARLLLSSAKVEEGSLSNLSLEPFAVYIAEISK